MDVCPAQASKLNEVNSRLFISGTPHAGVTYDKALACSRLPMSQSIIRLRITICA